MIEKNNDDDDNDDKTTLIAKIQQQKYENKQQHLNAYRSVYDFEEDDNDNDEWEMKTDDKYI